MKVRLVPHPAVHVPKVTLLTLAGLLFRVHSCDKDDKKLRIIYIAGIDVFHRLATGKYVYGCDSSSSPTRRLCLWQLDSSLKSASSPNTGTHNIINIREYTHEVSFDN